MLLWGLLALDDVNGAQVMVHFDHLRGISKRAYDLGFRLVADPLIKYQPPAVAPRTPFDPQGSWVPVDAPEVEQDPLGAQLARIGPEVKRAVAARLQDENPEWFQKEAHDG